MSDQEMLALDPLVDNANTKLEDVYKKIIPECEEVRIATGYFYLSGFDLYRDDLTNLANPDDRDPLECKAAKNRNHTSKCPSSVNPHAIWRGSITRSLNDDVPDKVVSDRANVSPEVIEQHYDRRSEKEKMEQRRAYLDD